MSVCIPKEIVDKMKAALDKGEIDANAIARMLPEEQTALKAILQDYVAEKLGVSVSKGEVAEITKLAKNIDEAQKTLGEDLGNPTKQQENIDFFKAKKAMDDYLLSRHPANRAKVLTGTIGRGMMLFSLKSPLLNIGSNIEVGLTEALSRRLATGQLKGTDNALATSYVKMVNKIYQATGYDVSRMTELKDAETAGGRVLGAYTHAQGPGATRKIGRWVEDVVFKQLMGAPDVAFSAAHFADSVNLNAKKFDNPKEVMADAMRLEPTTPEGEILRAQAVLDAQVATWTNKSWANTVSGGIRKVLNDVSGDARVGDYLLPFVKTPANVIATGMDYAGLGIPKALYKTFKAFKQGDLKDATTMQSIARDVVRGGLGLTGAVIIANQLSNDDFVGAYDPARAQIEALRNSNYNAIKVGDKWVSTDWLGPLAVPVTAMMYARKYGKTGGEQTFQYGKAVAAGALNIPGIADIFNYVKTNAFKANQTLEEATGATVDYVTSQLYSRLVPSFISDIAHAIDPTVRQGGKGLNGVIAKIPFLSETLPAKTDIFGNEVQGESALSDILFGSRVKTDRQTALVKEINAVSTANDKGINFTNWDTSSSKTLAQFKEKVGVDTYNEAKVKYGQELQKQLEATFAKPTYQRLSDEDKLKVINGKDADAMDKVFQQYGFRYHPAKSVKIPKGL